MSRWRTTSSPKSFSPSASFRMTYSGVCRRRFMVVLSSFPTSWGSDSHNGWISSRGPGYRWVIGVRTWALPGVFSVGLAPYRRCRGGLLLPYGIGAPRSKWLLR